MAVMTAKVVRDVAVERAASQVHDPSRVPSR